MTRHHFSPLSRHRLLLICALAVMTFLAACSGQATPAPTAEPAPAPTTAPDQTGSATEPATGGSETVAPPTGLPAQAERPGMAPNNRPIAGRQTQAVATEPMGGRPASPRFAMGATGEMADEMITDSMMIDCGYEWHDPYQEVADLLGIDIEALWQEWETGRSLAEMAEQRGISADAVLELLMAQEQRNLDDALANGWLTEAEVEEHLGYSREWVNQMVFSHNIPYPDLYQIVADRIGVPVETLYDLNDTSVATLAAEKGVDETELAGMLRDALNAWISAMEADGQYDAEIAASERDYIDQQVHNILNWVYIPWPDSYEIVADLTRTSLDQVYEAWNNGQSLAEYAAGYGVSLEQLEAVVRSEMAGYIERSREAGLLPEGEEIYLEESLTWMLDNLTTHNIPWPDPYLRSAELLGITQEELWATLESGTSIADLARERGIDPDTILQALIADELAYIDRMVEEGQITEADAADWRTWVPENHKQTLETTWDADPCAVPMPMPAISEPAVEG